MLITYFFHIKNKAKDFKVLPILEILPYYVMIPH